MRAWHHIKEWNAFVCIPPKCGTSSLKYAYDKTFARNIMHETKEVPHGPTCIAVIRDPIARFESLCRSKLVSLDDVPGWYKPQSNLLGDYATQIISIQEFAEWWDERATRKFPHINQTEGEIILTPEDVEVLHELYEDDFKLYDYYFRRV